MKVGLNQLFEEQLAFRTPDGLFFDSVYIGDTELLPVEVLRDDPRAYADEFGRWLEGWSRERRERRDQLLTLYGNRRRFADLCAAASRRQVVPFVGSGMSVPSGLPTWSELLTQIGNYAGINEIALERLIANGEFESAADLIASGTNKNLLNEQIEHGLRVDAGRIDGSVRLLPALFPNLIVTTNLDDILENIFRRSGTDFSQVLVGRDVARFRRLKSHSERFLLKLHGDYSHPGSRVLLSSEYEDAYGSGSAAREELALIYRGNSVLFLGSSLGPDRTVRLVREVAGGDESMPRHYAFLALPDSGGVPIDRERFLTERGIYPIWYDGPHDDAISALLAGLLDFVGGV
jgi:hypothetical protein